MNLHVTKQALLSTLVSLHNTSLPKKEPSGLHIMRLTETAESFTRASYFHERLKNSLYPYVANEESIHLNVKIPEDSLTRNSCQKP